MNQGVNVVGITVNNGCNTVTETITITQSAPCVPPSINFLNTIPSGGSTNATSMALSAQIQNYTSNTTVLVKVNGNPTNNYTNVNGLISGQINLPNGTLTIEISATNSCGTATESYNISRCKDATVTLNSPNTNQIATSNSTQLVKFNVSNVTSINQIALTLNNQPITGFNFSGNEVSANIPLNQGVNVVGITVNNGCNTVNKSISITYIPNTNGIGNGNDNGNNGHGNNSDGVDSSNPGQGSGGPNGQNDTNGGVDDENGNGSSGNNSNSGGQNNGSNPNNNNSNGQNNGASSSGNNINSGGQNNGSNSNPNNNNSGGKGNGSNLPTNSGGSPNNQNNGNNKNQPTSGGSKTNPNLNTGKPGNSLPNNNTGNQNKTTTPNTNDSKNQQNINGTKPTGMNNNNPTSIKANPAVQNKVSDTLKNIPKTTITKPANNQNTQNKKGGGR